MKKKCLLFIEEDLWMKFKHCAIDEDLSLSRLFTKIFKNYLNKKEEE